MNTTKSEIIRNTSYINRYKINNPTYECNIFEINRIVFSSTNED